MDAPAHNGAAAGWDYSERSIQNIRRSAALLAVLVLGFTIIVSWIGWRDVRNEQLTSLRTVAELETKAVNSFVRNIETGLIALGQDLTHDEKKNDLDAIHGELLRFLSLHPELVNVALIAPDGRVLVTALTAPEQTHASAASQPSFEEFLSLAQAGQSFVVGRPMKGAVSGLAMIPMRYAVRTGDDRISFVLTASLDASYLYTYWKDAPLLAKSAIGIVRDDGFLVNMYPTPPDLDVETFYHPPRGAWLIEHLQGSQTPLTGYVETDRALPGEETLTAFHRLQNYPLTMYITTRSATIRALWLERMGITYLSILLLIAAAAVAYRIALSRQATWNARLRNSEIALRTSEERFRTLIDANNAMIMQIDCETGAILDANDAAIRFYGWSRDALLAKTVYDITLLERAKMEAQARAIRAGDPAIIVRQHRMANGEVRTVEIHATPLHVGERDIFVSIITDITQRVCAEERMRALLGENEAILNSSIAGIAKTRDRCFVWVNTTFAQSLGYTAEELNGQSVRVIYPTEQAYLSFAKRAYPEMRNAATHSDEGQLRCKDGSLKWFEVRGAMMRDREEESIWFLSDISERIRDSQRITSLMAEQRAMLNNRLVGIVTVKDRIVIWANQAFGDMLGYAPAEIVGKATRLFFKTEEDWIQLGAEAYPLLSQGKIFRGKTRFETRGGAPLWVEISSEVLANSNGESLWCFIDISERVRIEQELAESSARLAAIIENEPESIKILDESGRVLQINPGGMALIEADSADVVVGRVYTDFIAPEYRDAYDKLHQRVLRGERVLLEYEVIGLRGTRRWLETHAVPMKDHGATVELSVARDITERKRMYTRVRQLAFQDSLTGLPNRRLLIDRLERAMSSSKRNETFGAILFVDLDNFKPLNDGHGHEAGDLLLMEVARRLRSCVREIDTVARFGGDEFVIVLSQLSTDRNESVTQAQAVAEKIRQSIAEPYDLKLSTASQPEMKVTHHCTVSIGAMIFLGHEASQDEILKRADGAMYEAKQAGRNCIRFVRVDSPG